MKTHFINFTATKWTINLKMSEIITESGGRRVQQNMDCISTFTIWTNWDGNQVS